MIGHNVRPYMGICFDQELTFELPGNISRRFRVLAYTAYSPGDWTAPEQNGVAVIDLDAARSPDARPVLVDGMFCQGCMCTPASLNKAASHAFLVWKGGSAAAFETDVINASRCRYPGGFMRGHCAAPGSKPVWVPAGIKSRPQTITKALKQLNSKTAIGYNEHAKVLFLEAAQTFWKFVVKHTPEWDAKNTRISVNAAGIAVSGEVYLRAPNFYAYISESSFGGGVQILFRQGEHGLNRYADVPTNLEKLKQLMKTFATLSRAKSESSVYG